MYISILVYIPMLCRCKEVLYLTHNVYSTINGNVSIFFSYYWHLIRLDVLVFSYDDEN